MRRIILFLVVICFIAGCLDSNRENKEEPQNQLPVARILIESTYQPIYQGDNVKFDGTRSYDDDGEILYYDWDIGGLEYSGEIKNIAFAAEGTFTVSLTVEDNNHTKNTDTTTITILPAIEIEILSWVDQDGIFVDHYLRVELNIKNLGSASFECSRSDGDFFFVYVGEDEYIGYIWSGDTDIAPHSEEVREIDFDNFPENITPDYLVFQIDENFNDMDYF